MEKSLPAPRITVILILSQALLPHRSAPQYSVSQSINEIKAVGYTPPARRLRWRRILAG
jgi:hypothetical protein